MAFRSLSDIVSHFFGSMYPRQIYFTGSSRFDGTICSLYHMVVRRSPKSTNGDSKNSIHGLTAIKPAAALFLICSALIKLCRIKRKIKGGPQERTTTPRILSLALVRTGNAELDHPRLQSCPFHAEPGSRSRRAADYPTITNVINKVTNGNDHAILVP